MGPTWGRRSRRRAQLQPQGAPVEQGILDQLWPQTGTGPC